MSERHMQLCRTLIEARDRPHDATKIPDLVDARGLVWRGHPPELILALWECPRYVPIKDKPHMENCVIADCPGYRYPNAGDVYAHKANCPVRRIEELCTAEGD